MIDVHMSSQRLKQHARGLHGSVPDCVLELKGEMDTYPPPELSPIDNNLQMKIEFSPMESHLGNKLPLSPGPMSSRRWPTQN